MIGDVAIGLFALLFWTGKLLGTHLKNGFDGRPTHHVNQLVDGTLGLLDEIEHRQQELTLPSEKRRKIFRFEVRIRRDNLIAFRHRWWLLFWGVVISG